MAPTLVRQRSESGRLLAEPETIREKVDTDHSLSALRDLSRYELRCITLPDDTVKNVYVERGTSMRGLYATLLEEHLRQKPVVDRTKERYRAVE